MILNIVIVFGILFVVIKLIPPQFSNLYQAEIGNKIERLNNITGQKIIYVTGSSGAFCVDSKKISEELNIEFVNLGLHAGFGNRFVDEIAKDAVNEGDIVILAHEFDTYYSDYNEATGGISLLATSINDNLSYLKYFSNVQKKQFINYLPAYIFTKLDKFFKITVEEEVVPYFASAFNEYGDIYYELPYLEGNVFYHYVNNYKDSFNDSTINGTKEFVDYAKERGAYVVFNFPFMRIEDNYNIDYKQVKKSEAKILSLLDLEALYPIEKSFKEKVYFFDTANHCNVDGKNEYTDLILNSLREYIEENDL